ncbi:hypothetical protein D3C80_2001960 [compost metagenome]
MGELQQAVEHRQPGAFADQGLVGQGRHAVLLAAFEGGGVRQRQMGAVEQPLLGVAD